MKREYLLMIGSMAIALLIALGLLRWFAPGLLGVPIDLQTVQVSREVPPFYANVLEKKSDGAFINDPIVNTRSPPFRPDAGQLGPTDLLGFRNRNIPNSADIIAIGDSQTYGNNAPIGANWPNVLESSLGAEIRVYSMATGGWGALQYLEMARHANRFAPKVLIVAFYTGNDPLESFLLAYGNEQWAQFKLDKTLSATDAPKIQIPIPESEWWSVKFKDGVRTIFTPRFRLASNNRDDPAVRAGYAIMLEAAAQIAAMGAKESRRVIFTIIPTKELVYAPKVKRDRLDAPEIYRKLVADESVKISELASKLNVLPNSAYVDVVAAMQEMSQTNKRLYSVDHDGHPFEDGYEIIGSVIAAHVKRTNVFIKPPSN